jgi:hypothetical protein
MDVRPSSTILRGQKIATEPPLIAASLSYQSNPERIIGVIKNLTERPIKDLHVRHGKKIGDFVLHQETPASGPATAPAQGATLQQIPPFATVRVEALLKDEPTASEQPVDPRVPASPDPNEPLWKVAGKLDPIREARTQQFLAEQNMICIDGEVDQPAPDAKLLDQKGIEQHWLFLRAVVELKQ